MRRSPLTRSSRKAYDRRKGAGPQPFAKEWLSRAGLFHFGGGKLFPGGELKRKDRSALEKWLQGRGKRLAVRSSAESEDSAQSSQAGRFESLLHVEPQDVTSAIRSVWESKNRASPFPRMAVIVQEMVDARISGVAFSRSPVGHSGDVLVEAAAGLGVGVVEGRVATETFRWNRWGEPLEGKKILTPSERDKLFSLVLEAEHCFGHPVDLEWALDGSEFASPASPSDHHFYAGNHVSYGFQLSGIISSRKHAADMRFRETDVQTCLHRLREVFKFHAGANPSDAALLRNHA